MGQLVGSESLGVARHALFWCPTVPHSRRWPLREADETDSACAPVVNHRLRGGLYSNGSQRFQLFQGHSFGRTLILIAEGIQSAVTTPGSLSDQSY